MWDISYQSKLRLLINYYLLFIHLILGLQISSV